MDGSQDDILWNDSHSDAATPNDEASDNDDNDDLYHTDAKLQECSVEQLEQAMELFAGNDDDDDEVDGFGSQWTVLIWFRFYCIVLTIKVGIFGIDA